RSLLFTRGSEITELDLEMPPQSTGADALKDLKDNALGRVEQDFLETALKQHQGDIKKVAENMGITSRAVYGKVKKYEINLADYRSLKSML
ncbi:MAG: sigma-54-dependent Fis family transcriptional regulator, partial [Methylovulum sp.]